MGKSRGNEGLKVITQRMSRQSLEESDESPFLSEDTDSGTESDKENSSENGGLSPPRPPSLASPVISSTKRPALTQCRHSYNQLPTTDCHKARSFAGSPRHDSPDPECESRGADYVTSWMMDLDGYSSEDELASFNCDAQTKPGAKRTWSKVNSSRSSGPDDTHNSPLNFSSSPPKGVRLSHTMSPKLFLASVLPATSLCCAPAWKKPR